MNPVLSHDPAPATARAFGPGVAGGRVILRLLARIPFVAAERADDTEGLDAVAGSEFVDDRIRRQD